MSVSVQLCEACPAVCCLQIRQLLSFSKISTECQFFFPLACSIWLVVLFVHPVCFCCEFLSDAHSNYRNVYIVLLLEPREFTCVILMCVNSTSQGLCSRELNGSRPFHFTSNRVGVTCMQPRLEKSCTAIVVYLFP